MKKGKYYTILIECMCLCARLREPMVGRQQHQHTIVYQEQEISNLYGQGKIERVEENSTFQKVWAFQTPTHKKQ